VPGDKLQPGGSQWPRGSHSSAQLHASRLRVSDYERPRLTSAHRDRNLGASAKRRGPRERLAECRSPACLPSSNAGPDKMNKDWSAIRGKASGTPTGISADGVVL